MTATLHHHHHFHSALLQNRRTITVATPTRYAKSRRQRYAVAYFLDGQNIFEAERSFGGVCWEADRTADRLQRANIIEPLILVGVDTTNQREEEFTATDDPDDPGETGETGKRFGRFLVEELKPYIDGCYRTVPDREQTAILGSSLGGLTALWLAWRYSDVFGLCGTLSPSLWWRDYQLLNELQHADRTWLQNVRLWFDMGTSEGGKGTPFPAGIDQTRQLEQFLRRSGLVPERDYHYLEVKRGQHNEAAWAKRLDRVLTFLFARKEDAS